MRRAMWVGLVLVLVAGGIALGVGAYHAGYANGLEANGATEVVRVYGYGHHGFFGFGFFLFPLFLIGLLLLFKGAARRRWGGHGHGDGPGPGPWSGMWEDRRKGIEELHRRLHEEGSAGGGAGGEPAAG